VRAAKLGMSSDPNVNEWTLVREQFDALLRERSDNIEDILDALFRNRFSEVITRAAERESRTKRDAKPI
jgi:hypothetical protein